MNHVSPARAQVLDAAAKYDALGLPSTTASWSHVYSRPATNALMSSIAPRFAHTSGSCAGSRAPHRARAPRTHG